MTATAILLRNANVFDSRTGSVDGGLSVRIQSDRIVEMGVSLSSHSDDHEIDLAGRILLPGFIDAHVHVTATVPDFFRLTLLPQSLITAQAKDILHGILMRGFTTVRDAGGADTGLVQAIERGHFMGPRLYIAGQAITQTGGHGDVRPAFFQGNFQCICCGAVGLLGRIADGVGNVRQAVREQIRNGAHHVKVMAGGGVSSPSDPLEGTQYSMSEMRAIVEEAKAARTYVMAHAYSSEAIIRAVTAGVRSIEHGNLLDAKAAEVMAQHGAYLVPTLATYDSLTRNAARLGWSDEMLAKLEFVTRQGIDAIRIARNAGVHVGFGSDLLGDMHADQSNEFTLQAEAMSSVEVLQSATWVNAQLIGKSDELGVIQPGAYADLLAVDGDPLRDISVLSGQGENIPLIIKAGVPVKNVIGMR